MFDNGMIGAVGFAMHEDRLAKAARNLRLAEAKDGSTRVRRSVGGSYRALLARALMTLAARIAPTVTRPSASPLALAQ